MLDCPSPPGRLARPEVSMVLTEPPPPEPSMMRTIGNRSWPAMRSAKMGLVGMVASAEPPHTVKSSPTTTTGRPSIWARPITQFERVSRRKRPSGSYSVLPAMAPISWKLPASIKASIRSRTVRRPPSCWRRTFSDPPISRAISSRALSSSSSSCQFMLFALGRIACSAQGAGGRERGDLGRFDADLRQHLGRVSAVRRARTRRRYLDVGDGKRCSDAAWHFRICRFDQNAGGRDLFVLGKVLHAGDQGEGKALRLQPRPPMREGTGCKDLAEDRCQRRGIAAPPRCVGKARVHQEIVAPDGLAQRRPVAVFPHNRQLKPALILTAVDVG